MRSACPLGLTIQCASTRPQLEPLTIEFYQFQAILYPIFTRTMALTIGS
jgi:hypothetical protein